MCRSGKLSKRPHSVWLSVSRRPFSSLIVSQPIKCFLKNNLLIIIIHIYSTYQYVSQGDVRISRETGEELNRVSWGTSKELFHPPTSVPFLHSYIFLVFFSFTFWRVSVCQCCAKRWFCAWAQPTWRPAAGAKPKGAKGVSVAAGSRSKVLSPLSR